jgi:hypothetical protein
VYWDLALESLELVWVPMLLVGGKGNSNKSQKNLVSISETFTSNLWIRPLALLVEQKNWPKEQENHSEEQ